MSFKVAKETVLLSLMAKTGGDRVGAGIPGRALRLRCAQRCPVIKCPLLGDEWHPMGCPSVGTGDINTVPPSQARTLIACKATEHPCSARLAAQSRLQDDARRCLSGHVCCWGQGCHSRGASRGGSQAAPAALKPGWGRFAGAGLPTLSPGDAQPWPSRPLCCNPV